MKYIIGAIFVLFYFFGRLYGGLEELWNRLKSGWRGA